MAAGENSGIELKEEWEEGIEEPFNCWNLLFIILNDICIWLIRLMCSNSNSNSNHNVRQYAYVQIYYSEHTYAMNIQIEYELKSFLEQVAKAWYTN